MTNWNPELLNEHIAPDFDRFTAAEIPDLRPEFPESRHWLADYFLNSVLSGRNDEPQRQLVLGLLRREEPAARSHGQGSRCWLILLRRGTVASASRRKTRTRLRVHPICIAPVLRPGAAARLLPMVRGCIAAPPGKRPVGEIRAWECNGQASIPQCFPPPRRAPRRRCRAILSRPVPPAPHA